MQREKLEAVARMQDYIKENLHEVITLHTLAKHCGYSPWYASRLFKEVVGISAFEYIRFLRLSDAALKLRDENCKIIDLAFDYLFNSQEGFTKAFSKAFGITPKQYALRTPPIKLFLPYSVRDLYEKPFEGGDDKMSQQTVFVQVVDRAPAKMLIKRGVKAKHYFEYCDEVSCDVWGILVSIKEALREPVGMWLPDQMKPAGTSTYVQGVEVPMDYKGEIPEGFELMEIPSCKMMIFQGQPFKDEEYDQAISSVWKAIDEYDPTLYGFKWAPEIAPKFQLEPQGYRGYIEGRPVEALGNQSKDIL